MEPSHQADAPEEHVKIEVDREHVFLLRKENEKQKLEDKIVRRSKLLTDLLDSKPGQATLPVDAGSLDGWRKYVQIYLTKERSEELSNIANEDMVMLVKVRICKCVLRHQEHHVRASSVRQHHNEKFLFAGERIFA